MRIMLRRNAFFHKSRLCQLAVKDSLCQLAVKDVVRQSISHVDNAALSMLPEFRASRAFRCGVALLSQSSRIVLGSSHIGIVNRGRPLVLPARTAT